jgi:hypothetical protein
MNVLLVRVLHVCTYIYNTLPMCKHLPVSGGIADRRKSDCKTSMHPMVATIGRNMQYIQTYGVFIPGLCRLNNDKSCLKHTMTLQYDIYNKNICSIFIRSLCSSAVKKYSLTVEQSVELEFAGETRRKPVPVPLFSP